MADLTTETVTTTGLDATANAAGASGDTLEYGSIFRVTNGSGSSITVTMVTPAVEDGDLAVADREVTVAAGESRYIKAAGRVYRDAETGRVSVTYSATADVTVEVIK